MISTRGSHATVRLAVDTSTQCQVACKSILLPKGRFAKNEVLKEVKILRSLCHVESRFIFDSLLSLIRTSGQHQRNIAQHFIVYLSVRIFQSL